MDQLVPERQKVDLPDGYDADGYDSDERPQWEDEEDGYQAGPEKTEAEIRKEKARQAQLGSFNSLKTGNAKSKYLSGAPTRKTAQNAASSDTSAASPKASRRSSLGASKDSSRRTSTTGALSVPTEVFDSEKVEETIMSGTLLVPFWMLG
jgi:hypothetical protein